MARCLCWLDQALLLHRPKSVQQLIKGFAIQAATARRSQSYLSTRSILSMAFIRLQAFVLYFPTNLMLMWVRVLLIVLPE